MAAATATFTETRSSWLNVLITNACAILAMIFRLGHGEAHAPDQRRALALGNSNYFHSRLLYLNVMRPFLQSKP